MSAGLPVAFDDNPDFNQWLEENYPVEIEEFSFPASDVLYQMGYERYLEALERYIADPKISLTRIENLFPAPIAYYFYQATHNYQNAHHRLDLLKSCWESIVFLLFGLVVAEARHRQLDLKGLGIKWKTLWGDRLGGKLDVTENILDHVIKNSIPFDCAAIIPLPVLADIKVLNQERNGFAHASAKTTAQQEEFYETLYPQLERILRQLIRLEEVKIFRYHDAQTPLWPRCEIFNGSSLDGRKELLKLDKSNYIDIVDDFDATAVYAQVMGHAFCLSPFIHFFQESHETNAVLCFYKKTKGGKYNFEIINRSQDFAFEKETFRVMEGKLRGLVV
ncbi:MAG: hypothetical protein AAF702_13225 [Chloroflexota bacterium]